MSRRPGALRRWIAGAGAAILVAVGLVATVPANTAEALSGSQFDPGHIISDQYFYDGNAMSQAEIQLFLNQKVGTCLNANCLNVLRVDTFDRPAADQCAPYSGAAQESAAAIIFKVQQACGISAKVLLVTLQKEQGLVTRTAPTDLVLRKAMGYGCPDTADCDSRYYGFYNQMYHAAKQLAWYRIGYSTPGSNFYQKLGPGRYSNVLFNPNAACGSAPVLIHNFATAALYHYTPYQPNAAALANLGGVGDACSSYGNRNFWVHYSTWFGNPTVPPGTPEGDLTSVSTSPAGVRLEGWAIDPDAVSSTVVLSVQLGSAWHAVSANQPGPDLSERFPGAGATHGFAATLPAPVGTHPVCVYLVNAGGIGGMGSLGCRTVTVPAAPAPVGEIESLQVSGQTVQITGWAVRPDAPTSLVNLAANVGASWVALGGGIASTTAPDRVAGAGPNQGFAGSLTLPVGTHSLCVWASRTAGDSVVLGCRSVTVAEPRASVAAIESVSAGPGNVTVNGWAVWPDAPSRAVDLAINLGTAWHPVIANLPSTAAETAVPGSGANHGFSATITAPVGTHQVCVWTTQPNGPATPVGCRTVLVGAQVPATVGELTDVTAGASEVAVAGWAVWPAAPEAAVPVAVNIGSGWYALSADQPNATAASAVPGAGPNHGYSGTIKVAPGTHTVCAWAAQQGAAAQLLGCRTLAVASGAATVGAAPTIVGAVGGVHFDGWAVNPADPAASVGIAANIGGTWLPFETGAPNAVAPTRVAGAGPNQGFSGLFPVPPGTHTLCVWAASPTGAVNLGCGTVAVASAPAVAGAITEAKGVVGGIDVRGWAAWPAVPSAPVGIAANVGTAWVALPSNLASTVTADYVLGAGPNQGFAGIVAAPSGSQTICIWGTSPTTGPVQLGCRTVTIP